MVWVESEPTGGGAWLVTIEGVGDRRLRNRLLDEGRALALAGAREIDISLVGLTYLSTGAAAALAELVHAMALLGITVRCGGAVGQPAGVLEALPSSALDGAVGP